MDDVSKIKGNILTRNHPRGTSLSNDDVRLAMTGELAEMRAAGKRYRYSIKPGSTGWSWNNTIAPEVCEFTNRYFLNSSRWPILVNWATQSRSFNTGTRYGLEWARATGLGYERTEW